MVTYSENLHFSCHATLLNSRGYLLTYESSCITLYSRHKQKYLLITMNLNGENEYLIKDYFKTKRLIIMTILKQLIVAIISVLLVTTTGQAEDLVQKGDTVSSETEMLLALSQQKWELMAAKDADGLNPLFHDESKFVHMSGTWKKARELDIIREGSI
jgi:hypothetical protein